MRFARLAVLLCVLVPMGLWMASCTTGGGEVEEATTQPTLILTLSHSTGVAPLEVTATLTAKNDDGTYWSPTACGIDWGVYNSACSLVGFDPSHTYEYQSSGTRTVTAWAADDRTGLRLEADAVVIVSPPDNVAPTCTLSADTDSGKAPVTVRFTGTGTDVDGTIASYEINFGDGSINWSSTAAPNGRAHTYTANGNYTATLTVTDDRGGTATAETLIVVS